MVFGGKENKIKKINQTTFFNQIHLNLYKEMGSRADIIPWRMI